MTDFDTFMTAAWHDHADAADAVAERLAASLHLVTDTAHIARYAGLATHVFGEHLARWDDGIALLAAVRSVPAFDASEAAEGALRRGAATLAHAREALAGQGGDAALAALARDDTITVLASSAAALSGQRAFALAIAAYRQAVALAASGPGDASLADASLADASPAIRALAVGGNNLAAALEAHPGRSDAETAGMVMAAEAGLHFWARAGTWFETQRAEYRVSCSRLQAGQASAAIDSAERCIALCQAHDAPAFERFFGQAALAKAQRAAGRLAEFEAARQRAEALLADIAEADRIWCQADLEQLRAEAPAPA